MPPLTPHSPRRRPGMGDLDKLIAAVEAGKS